MRSRSGLGWVGKPVVTFFHLGWPVWSLKRQAGKCNLPLQGSESALEETTLEGWCLEGIGCQPGMLCYIHHIEITWTGGTLPKLKFKTCQNVLSVGLPLEKKILSQTKREHALRIFLRMQHSSWGLCVYLTIILKHRLFKQSRKSLQYSCTYTIFAWAFVLVTRDKKSSSSIVGISSQ